MNLYHNFGVDNDDDWDGYLFAVDVDNKKRKRVDKWEQERINWEFHVKKLSHTKRITLRHNHANHWTE